MGIGGAIFLIAFGAILAYAFHVNLPWLDLFAMGWIFILSGLLVLFMTLWFWRDRRRRQRAMSVVEETRLIHDPGPVTPEPPDATPPP
jgi:uncharacterized membrane protein YbhN (UPF0104 family)